MNTTTRTLVRVVITVSLLAPNLILARGLDEDAALNLLLRTLKRDQVYDKRISLDCVTFDTEEKNNNYFEFVLRENHTKKCGGDPNVSPTVDRYRVYRASRRIERFDPVNDNWQSHRPAKIR
jgi:hypothetical protein